MIVFKFIILIFISFSILNANDDLDENIGFINVTSNVADTKIYLDGKYIGFAPIQRYQVVANKNIELNATANTNFYPKEYSRNINVKKLKIQSYKAEFKKANAKLLLIGEDGYLYINGRFERTLGSNNRVVSIKSGENINIEIRKGDNKYSISQDIYANKFYKLEYDLIDTKLKNNKRQKELVLSNVINIKNNIDLNNTATIDKKLKFVTIDTLMWQDSKDISSFETLYEDGEKYCKNLELEGYSDWYLPTIEQLKNLYKDKNKFFNKFKDNFYWSTTKEKGKYVYWEYLATMNFNENIVKVINGSSSTANQICVRAIIPE